MKHNLLEELIKFKFEKFNGIGHQNFRGCGNTWRQGHISRRVCTLEGTYQNRCGTAYVIIKSRISCAYPMENSAKICFNKRYIAVNNNCKRKKMSRRKRQKTGMINNENENNSMTQEPQTPQQTVDAQQMVIPQESERIQRAEWIHEQVKLQREAEDEAWEKIMEEQKLLTERRRSIDADINSNRELKRYHEDCMEDITDQVYSLHGISVDKLEGIKEYRNALFRGEAFIVFCISVIMAAIVAYAYGPTSQLCLYVLMCVGAEGALLSQKRKNILFFIPLILIAAEMAGYKLYPQYLEYVTMAGEALALLLMMIGTVGYFVHNPYRKDRKNIKAAKSDLKELHKVAKKSVKKNKKSRIKNEAKEAKLAAKQVKRETKAAIKEQKRQNKLAKKQAKYELKEKKRQQKSERVELKHELKKTQLMDKVRRFTPKEQESESTSSAESIDNNITENNIIENNIIDIERKVN